MSTLKDLNRVALAATLAALVSIGLSQSASANLIGDTITITSQAGLDTWTDDVFVVSGGTPELDGDTPGTDHVDATTQTFAALFSGDFIDVDGTFITINYAALAGGPTQYAFIIEFTGLDWLPTAGTLIGVTIDDPGTTLVAGFISDVTSSSFEFQGTVNIVEGANFTFNLIATHDPVGMPEPATVPLLAIGLLGLFYGTRRRRKR